MGVGSRKHRGEGEKVMSTNNSLRFAVKGAEKWAFGSRGI